MLIYIKDKLKCTTSGLYIKFLKEILKEVFAGLDCEKAFNNLINGKDE